MFLLSRSFRWTQGANFANIKQKQFWGGFARESFSLLLQKTCCDFLQRTSSNSWVCNSPYCRQDLQVFCRKFSWMWLTFRQSLKLLIIFSVSSVYEDFTLHHWRSWVILTGWWKSCWVSWEWDVNLVNCWEKDVLGGSWGFFCQKTGEVEVLGFYAQV